MVVATELHGRIAVVVIDNPPVNALGKLVREGLSALPGKFDADASVDAVVLMGAGKLFVGGADITEFDRTPEAPFLPDIVTAIENARKPWVAAMHGATLGGGLELAMGCRFRLATPDATFALPEVNLGIIPGAGGTQRLPRLIGAEAAVPVVAEKQVLGAARALALGLIDKVVEQPLLSAAVAFAETAASAALPAKVSERRLQGIDWQKTEDRVRRSSKGLKAPPRALAVLREGVENGFDSGMRAERAAFLELRVSEEAAALRHLFFAERGAARPADLRGIAPRPLTRAAVVGGGTMGTGIAAALRNAGLSVTLVERNAEALARGIATVEKVFQAAAKRGLTSDAEAEELFRGVVGTNQLEAAADCDIVLEAVFEDLQVKHALFAELAQICRKDAILATNTSYIDPRLIAEGVAEPSRFIGLHFFSPAHIMKLLEIVPIPQTGQETLATAFELAKRMGKMPVRSGICDGFIGNRILRRYRGEAEVMVARGVPFASIDAAMRDFGFAMGPFEAQDLAGLDISYLRREAARASGEHIPDQLGDLLVRAGRLGQKTGKGWYDYEDGGKKPDMSPEVAAIISPLVNGEAADMPADAIASLLVEAIADEGEIILAEKIASSPADIDLVEVHGYGFPRAKGGPMFFARRRGAVS